MRGKAGEKQVIMTGERITPAYAGKRKIKLGVKSPPRNHPRLCGEKYHVVEEFL